MGYSGTTFWSRPQQERHRLHYIQEWIQTVGYMVRLLLLRNYAGVNNFFYTNKWWEFISCISMLTKNALNYFFPLPVIIFIIRITGLYNYHLWFNTNDDYARLWDPIFIVKIFMDMGENFSENCPQFGCAVSKMLAGPSLEHLERIAKSYFLSETYFTQSGILKDNKLEIKL
jgi:hypothetical protein